MYKRYDAHPYALSDKEFERRKEIEKGNLEVNQFIAESRAQRERLQGARILRG